MRYLQLCLNNLISISLIIFLMGCVSINIPKPEAVKSEKVNFLPPGNPYESMALEDLDQIWKNPTNGNTISFLSNCNDPSDPSLKSIRTEIIARVEESKIIEEKYFNYNQRGAFRSHIKGMVEGLPTHFDVVILKKNSCIYILNYVGSEQSYQADLPLFDKFLTGFKVK